MDFKHRIRKGRKCVNRNTSSSSKRITCNGCKLEIHVPAATTQYRCPVCKAVTTIPISGSEQSNSSTSVNGRAKLSSQDQLDTANINGGFLSLSWSSSPSIASSSSFSFATRNKRAVLCGVSYGKRKFGLKGTINDVNNMKTLLVDKFNFPNEGIRVLTEKVEDTNLIPTKKNMLESLEWLVKDCQSGDSLVFYFSGHGLQQPEEIEGEEIDGLDEAICPVDFMKEGLITDNEINSLIVRPLKEGVILHAILDACHSATTLDLIYVYRKKKGIWKWEDNKPHCKEPIMKNTSGGLAICFSACDDNQMATDTAAFGENSMNGGGNSMNGDGNSMNGVMTYLFTKTIRDHSEITYGGLLEKIHDEILKINKSKYYSGFLRRIFRRKIDQDPLLSASEIFDVSKTRITI